MTSRIIILSLILAAPVLGADKDPVDAFLKENLKAPLQAHTLSVTGNVATLCTSVLGHSYAKSTIRYWTDSSNTAWIVTNKGKHGPIMAGFLIEKSTISASKVLADREKRGRPIRSKSYQKQFRGVGLKTDKKLSRRIDGITGATISSVAFKNMALLVLRLDALVQKTDK
jgi:hypothetical protein